MKRNDVTILIAALILLYGPYVLFGGFIRDDLGLLSNLRGFTSYLPFQGSMSSMMTMTARPVSAVLNGLCYWYLGTSFWAYHLINLSLFGGSLILVYLSVSRLLSREVGLLTAFGAMVYPCAGGTVFSSCMMNSNLAGFFWSSALYLSSSATNGKRRGVMITTLLLLSSLSYEAFIPLFAVNILIGIARQKSVRNILLTLLKQSAPVLIALLLFALYRGYLEHIIFNTTFSRIASPPPSGLVQRFCAVIILGARVVFLDSFRVSLRALNNLALLSPPHLLVMMVVLAVLAKSLYVSITTPTQASLSRSEGWIAKYKTIHLHGFPCLGWCVTAVFLFLCSHLIYVFSAYVPVSWGFENRTQGAIRFAAAFLSAVAIKSAYDFFVRPLPKRLLAASAIGLIVLFSLSMIGQREAWVAAARYNDFTITQIDGALRRLRLPQLKSLTLIAELPDSFPGQVNREPIFGEYWDIGSALSLIYPAIKVDANVYKPSATVAHADNVTIDGYWIAAYPFYFYRFSDNKIYPVASEEEWHKLHGEAVSAK